MSEEDRESRTERFGAFVAEAARDAGYDIDSPRGGGKKALAEAAGMSHASVSRMLAGLTIPDPSVFEDLARALRIDLVQLFVRSGLVSDSGAGRFSSGRPPSSIKLSLEESADRIGLTDPSLRSLYVSMASNLLAQQGLVEDDRQGVAV